MLQVELVQGKEDAHPLLGDVRNGTVRRPAPEQGHRDQVVHRPGRIAEAVDELVGHVVRILRCADAGDAAVQVHALLRGGDVSVRDGGGHRQIGGALPALGRGLPLLLQHRLLQQLQVQVIAHAHQKA